MEPFTAPRGRHFLLGAIALLLLTLQAGATGDARDVTWDAHIESVIAEHEQQQQPWLGRLFGKWGIAQGKECEEQYGIMPCSVTLGGNAALLVIYGYMLLKAAQLLSDGSELLLTVMSPGIIGGLVLPILGAFPDALLITVSGLGASQAEAQEEVLVGMGLVAGSSVMVLTALWGSCLIAGRCDLVERPPGSGKLVAKDKQLSPDNKILTSLTKSGVTNDKQTQWASWIMMATLLPYLVAQTPRLLGLNTEGHAFILVAAVIAVLGLCGYCAYQLATPWYQQRKIDMALHKYKKHAIHKASRFTEERKFGKLFKDNGEADEEVLKHLFDHFDNEKDGHLTDTELNCFIFGIGIQKQGKMPNKGEMKRWMAEFDKSEDGKISWEEFREGFKKWVKACNAQKKKSPTGSSPNESNNWDQENQGAGEDMALVQQDDDDDDDDDDDEEVEPSRNQVIRTAVCYLIAGAAVAAVFADPLVDAIGGFSKASGISPFFISFIATPLATNSSEAISSLIFARRKRKKTISMTYSQIYGAVTMNNTMCLGIFLAIVYFRSLLWDFSAEISVIFFATLIMGSVAAFRTTFPLWMAFIGLALYPLSIALVAFLDYVCGWH